MSEAKEAPKQGPKLGPKFVIQGVPFYYGGEARKKLTEDAVNFKFEKDDILIAGYPRTGTTFRRQIIWLVAHDADIETAKAVKSLHRVPMLDKASVDEGDISGCERARGLTDRPRVLFTHLPYKLIKDNVEAAGCKVIYLMRNPKDVVVSSFHAIKFFLPELGPEFKEVTFEQAVKFMSIDFDRGNMIDHMVEYWQQRDNPNFLYLFFEDHHGDNSGIVKKVAKFLGKQLTAEQEQKIVDFVSFDKYQKHQNKENESLGNRDTTQTANFVRKGAVGDWKNYFTVAQSEFFDTVIAKRLNGVQIPFTYE